MPAANPCWIRSLTSVIGLLVVGATISPATSQAPVPTLQSMARGAHSHDYTVEQLRRFRDGAGNVVAVRERLEVDANGSTHPDFAVTFLGVEGELPGSTTTLEWQRVYHRFAPLFYTHGMFRVRDLAAATANYTVHDFGNVVRASRTARRVVVFPGALDKAIWVVDVDVQTNVPLYFAEFDVNMHVLAEVEVQTFAATCAPLPLQASSAVITQLSDFAAAAAFLGHPPQIVDPVVTVASEYRLDGVQVQIDPLNGRKKLTMTYTDGVDQFVVVQAPGTPDVFAGLPGKLSGGNVIARFRDPAMSVLLFWEGGVSFHVAGRGSLRRLDELARRVYVQALAAN